MVFKAWLYLPAVVEYKQQILLSHGVLKLLCA
eukprot:COSAG02_NODE_34395_length_484_cov_14.885714_2_plen_31_part_01